MILLKYRIRFQHPEKSGLESNIFHKPDPGMTIQKYRLQIFPKTGSTLVDFILIFYSWWDIPLPRGRDPPPSPSRRPPRPRSGRIPEYWRCRSGSWYFGTNKVIVILFGPVYILSVGYGSVHFHSDWRKVLYLMISIDNNTPQNILKRFPLFLIHIHTLTRLSVRISQMYF